VLGLPGAWAERVGVDDFVSFLRETVHTDEWASFWSPAQGRDEIALRRPFYPRRPGGARMRFLWEGLRLSGADALRRVCDRPIAGLPTPCPLFWTLGANQVGKASLSLWKDVVILGLQDPELSLRLWPFRGALSDCLSGGVTLAEVYPALIATRLDLDLRRLGGKRVASARAEQAPRILEAFDACGAHPTPEFVRVLERGFGSGTMGEDAFDAALGCLGLLLVLSGGWPLQEPGTDPRVRVEGWVLGRDVSSDRAVPGFPSEVASPFSV